MLGILLHDIGKALGHGHAAKGVPLIKAVTRRLNLDADDAAAVEFLVEHHLLLSHIAERRDLDDPKTVERLAAVARFPAWLTMLYLLTCADIRAVGPASGTRGGGRCSASSTSGRARGWPGAPRRPRAGRRWPSGSCRPWRTRPTRRPAARHLQAMSDRYVRTTSPQRMAAHLRLIDRLREEAVVTEVFHFPDLGASDFVVVTRDTAGLFALIAGTLAAHGVNILSAQIETRADGVAVDTLPRQRPRAATRSWTRRRWEAVTRDLRRALAGECSVEALLAERRPRRPGLVRPSTPGPARVTVDNSLSDTHTVVEVKAPDRVGLLYLVTRALAAEGLDIATAKIATDLRPRARRLLRDGPRGPQGRGARGPRAPARGHRRRRSPGRPQPGARAV